MLSHDQISILTLFAHGHRFYSEPHKLCGLDSTAPDYSILSRRQKYIAIGYHKSSYGLYLLVDSTGLNFLGEGEKIILGRQAYAVIPLRKNTKFWEDKKLRSLERNELLKMVKFLERTIWKKWFG